MPSVRRIDRGEIHEVDNFPPLDGHSQKRRPVVVLGPINPQVPTAPILVIGISHTASTPEKDPDMLRLPDLTQSPTVRTGLTKPSWAIPRWFLLIDPAKLAGTPKGFITGENLRRLIAATYKRIEATEDPKSSEDPSS